MKILYAAQATGNGHLSRAREIVPILRQYGTVDMAVSGTQSDVKLPFPIRYQKRGTSFIFGKKGGIDWVKTAFQTNFYTLINDILSFSIEQYDIIFNDFEPVVAWACAQKGIPCIGLSHQGAFLSDKTPRPKHRQFVGEFILKHFAPVATMHAFHFQPYDTFIHTPVIRQEIRQAIITQGDHIAVYLPAVSDKYLIKYLSKVKEVRWEVFSKRVQSIEIYGNVTISPVNNDSWIRSVASAQGALMGAGFEGPAETLFMGKKLMVMPMIGQYEQSCNAAALEALGVPVFRSINRNFDDLLRHWLYDSPHLQVNYPDETAMILETILNQNGIYKNQKTEPSLKVLL